MTTKRKGRFVRPRTMDLDLTPTVSVVIPTYNYERYLPQAVQSVLSQEDVDVQVIIVDDCSTDDSLSVARGLALQHRQVQVVQNAKNCGPVYTFNHGLDHVTGEFLVRLDADDLLTPGSLRRAADVCNMYPEVGLVYGHPLHFQDGPLPPARNRVSGWSLWKGLDWVEERCRTGVNVITSPEAFVRMSVVHQVGGQCDLAHGHDMEMWLRVATVSDVVYIRNADQAWHRDHDLSLSAQHVDVARDITERWLVFATLFDALPTGLERMRTMRAMAEQAMIDEGLGRLDNELRLGMRNTQLFENLAETVSAMNLDADQQRLLEELRQQSRYAPRYTGRELSMLARRIYGRLRREYRQRHWRSFGVY